MFASQQDLLNTRLSDEVLDRIRDKRANFLQLACSMDDPNTEIHKKNYAKIKQPYFTSIGKIPYTYYDDIIDGYLMVKDRKTGELIKKQDSYMCHDGLYIRRSAVAIQFDPRASGDWFLWGHRAFPRSVFTTAKVLPTPELKNLIHRALSDVFSGLEYFSGLDDPIENTRQFTDSFIHSFNLFSAGYSLEDFVFKDSLLTPLSTFLPGLSSEIFIATANSSILDYQVDRDTTGLLDFQTSNRPFADPQRWQTVHLSDKFAITFSLKIAREITEEVGSNHVTYNQSGGLLEYSSRVNMYKTSFMMLPEEREAWRGVVSKYRLLKGRVPANERPIFLGVELEASSRVPSTGARSEFITSVAKSTFGNHCIVKADSSTGRYGMEIVTVPATLDYHKKIFTEHFFNAPNALHKKITSNNACGIHVHISKNVFTSATLYRFLTFINNLDNHSFINAMAGRHENGYCVRTSADPSIIASNVKRACKNQDLKAGLAQQRIVTANRREAVNLQNAETVEVRIFKSSTDKNSILRKLEFCESLVHFTRQYQSRYQMTVFDYINFILEKPNRKRYSHILKWLGSKNYIGYIRIRSKKTGALIHKYTDNKIPIPSVRMADGTIFHNERRYPQYFKKGATN